MTTINEIFKEYGPEYIERFNEKIPKNHLNVINAIIKCKTDECGIVLYECKECGENHIFFRSCGNRHCPTCQNQKSSEWLIKQSEKQLPGHHFMITFTLPEKLRQFVRSNQKFSYAAMFKTSSEAIKKLAADKKFIGGDLPGFFGVLHTWGRQLQYHPHIHYIVPGGAFSKDSGLWHPSRIDFYVPVKALSKIYKAKFKDELKKNGLINQISPDVWAIDWVVNIQAVGNSYKSVKYLAPYVFKVGISNSRIVNVEHRKVTFSYKKKKSYRSRTITVDVIEFIRRFLQHVLPIGFMKVRYFGFMHPCSSVSLEKISELIELTCGYKVKVQKIKTESCPPLSCPSCGGELSYMYSVLPYQMIPQTKGG